MLNTLRARLIAISTVILVLALLLLSAANFFTVQNATMTAIIERMARISDANAERVGVWLDGKRQAALSIKDSIDADNPISGLQTARVAGEFPEAFFVLADKRPFFTTPPPPRL